MHHDEDAEVRLLVAQVPVFFGMIFSLIRVHVLLYGPVASLIRLIKDRHS
jgi:hypothetical protein